MRRCCGQHRREVILNVGLSCSLLSVWVVRGEEEAGSPVDLQQHRFQEQQDFQETVSFQAPATSQINTSSAEGEVLQLWILGELFKVKRAELWIYLGIRTQYHIQEHTGPLALMAPRRRNICLGSVYNPWESSLVMSWVLTPGFATENELPVKQILWLALA